MYRPIDVIFHHPVKKFTVIYQNGVLWQLPMLKIDSQSLNHKKRYRGSRKELFVARNQLLEDAATLAGQLQTIALPPSIIGRDVDEFEHWWRHNWFKYSKKIGPQTTLLPSPPNEKTPTAPMPMDERHLSKASSPPTHVNNTAINELLDHMLQELMND